MAGSDTVVRNTYVHGNFTQRVEHVHQTSHHANRQVAHSKQLEQEGKLPELKISHAPAATVNRGGTRERLSSGGLRGETIILDPGHGGNNFGTLGDKHGAPEKVVTLQIAEKLKPILEHAGAKVIMTRDHDQDVSVSDRAALSQRARADLFLSIHCNEGKAQGALSLYEQSDSVGKRSQSMLNLSKQFAEVMVDTLSRGTGANDKGAHPGSYAHVGSVCVLHHNTVPSTLVEVGFLNGPEGQRLRDRNYQQKIADNLAIGLRQYVSVQRHSDKSY